MKKVFTGTCGGIDGGIFEFLEEKKFRLRYWNWTLVLVPDTETEFQSHTSGSGQKMAIFADVNITVLMLA